MVYYGVSLSSQTLDGNMYLNFFLTSIIEIPANAAAIYCMKRYTIHVATVSYCRVMCEACHCFGSEFGFRVRNNK